MGGWGPWAPCSASDCSIGENKRSKMCLEDLTYVTITRSQCLAKFPSEVFYETSPCVSDGVTSTPICKLFGGSCQTNLNVFASACKGWGSWGECDSTVGEMIMTRHCQSTDTSASANPCPAFVDRDITRRKSCEVLEFTLKLAPQLPDGWTEAGTWAKLAS